MRIGHYDVNSVEIGRFRLDGGAMFSIVPKQIWGKKNTADEQNRIDLTLRSMLITGNGHNILVDTGNGYKFTEKYVERYNIDYREHNINNALKKHNLTVNDITHVILTHLHFDHAGGATLIRDGSYHPAFPNAKYYIQRRHLELARNPSEKDTASFFKENFDPLERAGCLRVLDRDGELFPYINLIISDGHTTGQQLVKVTDGTNTVVYCADLIPTLSHLPIPYVMSYDLYPLTTMEEKRKLLNEAANGDWILLFEHDPFAEAVKVMNVENGYKVKEKINL